MSITAAQYERISRFLNAAMDTEAMEAFEAELLAHPAMRQQLDFELMVRDGLAFKQPAGINNKTTIQVNKTAVVTAENNAAERKRPLAIWMTTGVAASLLLVCALLFLFRQPAKKTTAVIQTTTKDTAAAKAVQTPGVISPSNDSSTSINGPALFAKYYTKDRIPDSYPIYLADALARYEAGDYTGLQQLNLADIPATRGSNAAAEKEQVLQLAHYYKGICWLQTGSIDKAITHFDWVIKNKPGNQLQEKAEWYLALAFLKKNETGKTREILKGLIAKNQNTALTAKAKTLFSLLENRQ